MKNNSINSTTSAKPAFNIGLTMIGENIRKRREALGMSQTELANEVGTNRSAICKYESGVREMGVDKLLAIADALQCAPAVLVSNQGAASSQGEELLQRIMHLDEIDRNRIFEALEFMVAGAEKMRTEK